MTHHKSKKPLPSLKPFLRRGVPVPLTSTDYALRTDTTSRVAGQALLKLVNAGLVVGGSKNGQNPIYDLTAEGVQAATTAQGESE